MTDQELLWWAEELHEARKLLCIAEESLFAAQARLHDITSLIVTRCASMEEFRARIQSQHVKKKAA